MKILLNSSTSKTSRNENNTINVELSGGKRLLPTTEFTTLFSELEQYNNERKSSNLLRLTCTINPICTNVLHNMVSEIVYKEGSDEAISMNFNTNDFMDKVKNNLVCKTKSHFNSPFDAIEDTQMSSIDGVTYHCGLDIFNNHILRSNTFRAVNFIKNNSTKQEFNTISDYLRDYRGENIVSKFEEQRSTTTVKARIYNYDNIDTFENCVKNKLHDQNGWLGFYNKPKLTVFTEEQGSQIESKFNKVICNKKPCSFVDLAPERDLFYFTPKYNPYRERLEKNWHYFLTYPSSSTTNVSFIDEKMKTLKIVVFDDNTKNSNGFSSMVFYSVSMHGLKLGDMVNIYSNGNVVFENAIVNEIVDPYVFMVGKSGVSISNGWRTLESLEDMDGIEISDNRLVVTISGTTDYYAINEKVNLDPNTQELSFAKVINGRKCDYYVRIFSKVPNWKFVDEKVTEYSMYKNGSRLITKYQDVEDEFENHVSKLSFAKNAYSDDIGEIVFTDDIDLSYLKDNLNRDVHEIYLTILKANDGYKEWYGNKNTTSDAITYSHVFGKLSCGFELSKESLVNDSYKTIRNVTNSKGHNVDGLDMSVIRETYAETNIMPQDSYEVDRNFDKGFYGDLVCFSPFDFTEESIQMSCFRFNTMQREFNAPPFNQIRYNEIEADQDDTNGTSFVVRDKNFNTQISDRREGYVYESHYRIPIHTFSTELKTQMPKFYTLRRCIKKSSKFIITTLEKMYLEENDKFTIYDRNTRKYYNGVCEKVIGNREIVCNIVGEEDEMFVYNAVHRYKMFKPDETIPTNAYLVRDGSCRYIWRDLIRNGYDNNMGTDVEHYPFANGRLYVNSTFNLFVRRQDPHDYVNFYSKHFTTLHPIAYPYDNEPKEMQIDEINEYFNNELITC